MCIFESFAGEIRDLRFIYESPQTPVSLFAETGVFL